MRTCPFHDCGAAIPDKLFACRTHWFALTRTEKSAIDSGYERYMQGHIDIVELRRIQEKIDRKLEDGVKPADARKLFVAMFGAREWLK